MTTRTNRQYVAVFGLWKSATSSLVGMLNSHPSCLILYESDLTSLALDRYSKKLLADDALYPAISCWRDAPDAMDSYRDLAEWSATHLGKDYQIIGTKFPNPDVKLIQRYQQFRHIYIHRDLDEWLVKIDDEFIPSQLDCRRAIYFHLKSLLQAQLSDDLFFVKYSQFMGNNEAVTKDIFNWLGLEIGDNQRIWWNTVGKYDEDHLKNSQNWWRGHRSSMLKPGARDTHFDRRDHPIWEFCDQFSRKYAGGPSGHSVGRKEISSDIEKLAKIFKLPATPKSDLYERFATDSLALRPKHRIKRLKTKILRSFQYRR